MSQSGRICTSGWPRIHHDNPPCLQMCAITSNYIGKGLEAALIFISFEQREHNPRRESGKNYGERGATLKGMVLCLVSEYSGVGRREKETVRICSVWGFFGTDTPCAVDSLPSFFLSSLLPLLYFFLFSCVFLLAVCAKVSSRLNPPTSPSAAGSPLLWEGDWKEMHTVGTCASAPSQVWMVPYSGESLLQLSNLPCTNTGCMAPAWTSGGLDRQSSQAKGPQNVPGSSLSPGVPSRELCPGGEAVGFVYQDRVSQ